MKKWLTGEIHIMPPNKTPHPYVVDDLTAAFRSQLPRKRTLCIGSTFGFVIRKEPLTCRSPDIAVFDRATMIEQDGCIHSALQLVIEVLSPSETRKALSKCSNRCRRNLAGIMATSAYAPPGGVRVESCHGLGGCAGRWAQILLVDDAVLVHDERLNARYAVLDGPGH